MSSYVAFYLRRDSFVGDLARVRYIDRGFSCTKDELPNEMKVRCRADTIPEWTWVSCRETADELIQNAKDRGFRLDTD